MAVEDRAVAVTALEVIEINSRVANRICAAVCAWDCEGDARRGSIFEGGRK